MDSMYILGVYPSALRAGSGLGLGSSKVVVTFNHVGGSFDLFKYHHQGCLNNPIFLNLGFCAACRARFICCHKLWPTSVSYPFSSLNSFQAMLEENVTRKFLSPSLDLFFKFLLFQVAFFIFFSIAVFSPYFLLFGLLLQYVALFQFRELVNVLVSL